MPQSRLKPLLPFAVCLVVALGSSAVGVTDDAKKDTYSEGWQTDYKAFERAISEVLDKENDRVRLTLAKFNAQPVRWEMKFKRTRRDKEGDKIEFEGTPANLIFLAAKGSAWKWGQLRPGTTVTVEGKTRVFEFVLTNSTMSRVRGREAYIYVDNAVFVGKGK